MAKRRVYVRDRKGQFARTGTRSVSSGAKKTTKAAPRKTTVRKTTTAKSGSPRRRKVKPDMHTPAGAKKAMQGKSVAKLAKASGLTTSEVRKLTATWQAKGVPQRYRAAPKRKRRPKPVPPVASPVKVTRIPGSKQWTRTHISQPRRKR